MNRPRYLAQRRGRQGRFTALFIVYREVSQGNRATSRDPSFLFSLSGLGNPVIRGIEQHSGGLGGVSDTVIKLSSLVSSELVFSFQTRSECK